MAHSASAWTHYWQTGQAHSCINSSSRDGEELAALWQDLANLLPAGARVLDLATGNGAVAEHFASTNPNLNITGVDQADITPVTTQVSYQGRIDITELPFADGSFDMVTSQFGFEYAPRLNAAEEAARVLADGGQLCFLMHHPCSAVVKANSLKIPEIDSLLASDGLISQCREFLSNQLPFATLENAGRSYLDSDQHRSKQISGQVFDAVGVLFDLKQRDPALARRQLEAMATRMLDERARLQQMRDAAVSTADIQHLVVVFTAAGITVEPPVRLHIGGTEQPALVGWLLKGRR
jgi:ubiquinone/menaquinone biosynthesis C-methylase UbiE